MKKIIALWLPLSEAAVFYQGCREKDGQSYTFFEQRAAGYCQLDQLIRYTFNQYDAWATQRCDGNPLRHALDLLSNIVFTCKDLDAEWRQTTWDVVSRLTALMLLARGLD